MLTRLMLALFVRRLASLIIPRRASSRFATALILLGALAAPAFAHETLKLDAPKPQLAPTPPMGWNSWNKFGCNINEALAVSYTHLTLPTKRIV